MNRQEALEFLLKELKKVPNRDVCRVATEKQMKRIAIKLNFEKMEKFLEYADLELKISEVPRELHTEVILYFCMLAEYQERTLYDEDVWQIGDEATATFLADVKSLVELYEDEHLQDAWIADFLEYAKSDKPDF